MYCDIIKEGDFMFIRVTKSPTAKYKKVYLVEGYRDENGKSKQRIIKCYGNLEELEANDPDILQKLKDSAKLITKNQVNLTLNLSDSNDDMEIDKNYGYFFLERLYNELSLPQFFKSQMRKRKHVFDLNEVFQLLLYGRILKPASKKSTFENKDEYFESFKVTINSIYESLSLMKDIKEDLQQHLHEQVSQIHGRDTSLVFFDVTNYYFESDLENNLKKVGISKQKRTTPIVQMSLAIDRAGLPVGYDLFLVIPMIVQCLFLP
ncbi:hypothetical protein HZR23_12020 [Serpentinicella alkaliphila]|uniref:IS1634 family transposase n=1 Tax=Serpentinicella alkaliphila TaxID=1734049 RepID=UPI001BC82C3A|nr:hypothetical protein [Serpentinicella alkaliphila]QUH26382.1 hypothetical protein HZR23_12020 [Serpentinicella alkaliphila]